LQFSGGFEPFMIEKYIEHTLLKPEATTGDMIKFCMEARTHNFMGV